MGRGGLGRDGPRLSPGGQAVVAAGSDKRAAMRLLRERGIPASRIVAADPFGISYLSQDGEPMTAWTLWLEDRKELLVWSEPGFPAFAGGVVPGA